jgi:hypothetical protein
MIGNGIIITKHATAIVTGTSGSIDTTQFVVLCKTVEPNLIFCCEENNIIDFDEDSGIFTVNDSGCLDMTGVINVQASQASAEFQMIPQFDDCLGAGWYQGNPRKKVITAIKPDQLTFVGSKIVEKGTNIRFQIKAASGNITFNTETIAPGTAIESVLPAAIFYFTLHKTIVRI